MLSPFAAAYAREISGGDPGFSDRIDPADEMYSFGLGSLRGSDDAAALLYFSVGRLIADSIQDVLAWRFGGRPPASLLDFAAGYGRATRFLVRRLPPDAITVAEIDPAALGFQEKAFGVRALLAPAGADGFRPLRTWAAVAAASFFSHLSETRFEAWLAALWNAVAPGGVLVFSTHGPALLREAGEWSRGIVFRAESETRRLDPDAYGTSWVTAEFVAAAARRSCPGGAFHAIPFGLDGRQDLYVVAREPGIPATIVAVRPVPRGDLDHLELSGSGRLRCEGRLDSDFAADVAFFVRHQERARLRLGAGKGPRAWRFDVDLAGVPPDDVLRIEGSAGGRTRILAMGTLRPHIEARDKPPSC